MKGGDQLSNSSSMLTPKDQYYNNKLMLAFQEVSYCNEEAPRILGASLFRVTIF